MHSETKLARVNHPDQRQDHLTFRGNLRRNRHNWLRLTPAYSVDLVSSLVARLPQDSFVLDPFCGTGTTALVCAQRGIRCHTVDINPFLVWLAQRKTRNYAPGVLAEARDFTNALAEHAPGTDSQRVWKPPLKDIEKWWDGATLHSLAHLLNSIRTAPMQEGARDLLLVTFCRAAIQLASVSFGHQSMSFKQRSDRRLVAAHLAVQSAFAASGREILAGAEEPVEEALPESSWATRGTLRASSPRNTRRSSPHLHIRIA